MQEIVDTAETFYNTMSWLSYTDNIAFLTIL